MNSTTVLEELTHLANESAGENIDIDITILAARLGITIPVLVSMLTELEHRDEITIDISSVNDPAGILSYSGNVRLMRRPPDERQ